MSNIISAGNLSVSGNQVILGNSILGSSDKTLIVNSVSTFNNDVNCDNLISNDITTDNLTVNSLTINENITFDNIINNGDLLQNGISLFNSSATFNSGIISNNLTVSNNITSNNITSNNLTISDEIIVTGDATFDNLTIDNITVDNITVNGESNFNDVINFNSGIKSTNAYYFGSSSNIFDATAISNPKIINGISSGTSDGSSYTNFNLSINSWYGIGFVYSNPAVSVCKCVIDTRSGNISTQGYINSGGITNITNPITNNAILDQNSTANFNSSINTKGITNSTNAITNNSTLTQNSTANFNSSINTTGLTNSTNAITNNSTLTQNSTANFNSSINTTGLTNSTNAINNNGVLNQNSNANFNGTSNTFYNNVLFLNPNQTLPSISSSIAGLGLYWNVYNSGGNGETTFLNYSQGGVGGFAFNNVNNSSTQKNLVLIDSNGNVNLNNVKYNYTSLPTLSSNSIGYRIRFVYSGSNTFSSGSNSYFTSDIIVIPIGIWLVNAYSKFSVTTVGNYILGLGISNSINALTDYNFIYNNYYQTPTSQSQTLTYQYYLSISTPTNFYVNTYANISAGGTLNYFNADFIRIA